MSSILTQASRQWATRPADQRFTSLTELAAAVQHAHDHSKAGVVSSRQISAKPVNTTDLVVVGPNGNEVAPTHWAFGQLAQRAGAPAGYLRDLPAPIAADCINYGLQFHRDVEDLGIMLYKNGGPAELRAVTGPNYGRVWNSTVANALVSRFGDGVTGQFRVPGEFGKAVEVSKENTTLYASDRDMFVFLADEVNRIEITNRRDGKSGSLARGFFVWNSDVGNRKLGLALFLFDYTCSNRIVWGAQDYQEITVRHTASAPDRWLGEVMPAIESYSQASTTSVVHAITAAQRKRVDDLDKFLAARFTGTQVSAIKAAHMNDEQRPMETIWDVATGVTAYARSLTHQDARIDLEREAGKILKLAA
jgi:hypothetical protein